MARKAQGPVRGSTSDGNGSTVEQWASKRQLYLDNLKVLLIAAIIAGHGVVSYATMVSFAYADVREVTLSPLTEAVALALVAPFGYLWFVGDLLIFSLAYAGWVRIRGAHRGPSWRGDVKVGHLVGLAAVVTLATFLVRLVSPFDSEKDVDLNLYQWPECVALFALGVMASGNGWLTAVPDRLRRQSRNATLAAVGGFAAFTGLVSRDRPRSRGC